MKTRSQTGSAHVLVTVILVVALLGALGFIFWQNFATKKNVAATNATAQTITSTTAAPAVSQAAQPATATQAPAAPAPADMTKYVTLDTWAVKFAAPTDGTTVQWAASDSSTIGFSTNHLTTGELCNAQNGAAGTLVRSTSAPVQKNGVSETVLNNGQPINGYYYAFDLPNGQHCDDTNPSDYQEAQKIQELVKTLVAA